MAKAKSEFVDSPDGEKSTRKYLVLVTPAWLSDGWPEEGSGKLPTVKLFVDNETSVVVVDPFKFEAWINDHETVF